MRSRTRREAGGLLAQLRRATETALRGRLPRVEPPSQGRQLAGNRKHVPAVPIRRSLGQVLRRTRKRVLQCATPWQKRHRRRQRHAPQSARASIHNCHPAWV